MNRYFGYGLSALSPFCGLFCSVRLNAFLLQVTGWSYSSWGHLLAAALFFLAVFLLRDRLTGFLVEHAYGLSIPAILVYVLSIAGAFASRYLLLTYPIEGTAVGSPFVLTACLIGCGVLLGVFLLLIIRALQLTAPVLWRCVRALRRRDWIFLAGLLAVLNGALWLYMHLSETIYFWDTAGYWTTTHMLADLLRAEGPGALLREAYSSVTTSDYNYLIALPGTLLTLLFGKSRYVFLAGIVNIYVFPLCALLYLFVRRHWRRPMLLTGALILFFPALMYITLVGFIDVAGVIPCLLAVLLYFHADRRELHHYLITGCLLALAILLRRWYVFFALSFMLAAAVDCLVFKRSARPLLGVLLPMGFTLLFFFQRFVSERLLADYGAMYAAYQMGLSWDFSLFFSYFGLIITVLVLITALYLLIQRETRPRAAFLLIQAVSCFFLFTAIQSHGEQHLLLYLPFFLWFGAQGLGVLICLEPKPGPILAIGLAIALVPTASCVVRTQSPSISEITVPPMLPSMTFRPEVRVDIDDILALTAYLDELVEGTEDRVALLSSSFTLNYDTLCNAEISLNLRGSGEIDRSYLLALPAVDSRDGLPLGVEGWDYVAVASPLQTHLGEENQRVVTVPAESFLNGTDIALAYTQLPETFVLRGHNIEVYIFRRDRENTEAEYQGYLDRLREAMPEKYTQEVGE